MQVFTNATIDITELPKFQDTALTKPNAKYWNVIVINLILLLAVIGIAITILIIFQEKFRENWMIWTALYTALVLILFSIYKASFKRRGFALREKDVIYKSGIISETTTIIPLNRIQHVALNEGIFSRFFKLGTLQIYTAGGSSGEIHIAGIPIDQAKTIKEALVKRLDIQLATI